MTGRRHWVVVGVCLASAWVGVSAPSAQARPERERAAQTVRLDGVPVRLHGQTRQVVTVNHTAGHHARVTFWARNRDGWLGRDHHPHAYSMFMAGGGVKPGLTWGTTDDIGYQVVENPVHVHDLQATILHLMGLDHERLTYRFQGRDYRLTDVHGHVVNGLLA